MLLGQAYPVIFLRQQNRGAASVGFRDNPEPRAIARAVGRQNAPAGLKADSFSRPVELIHVAPIMRDVMNEAAKESSPSPVKAFYLGKHGPSSRHKYSVN